MRIVTTWKGLEDFDAHLEIPVSDSSNGASNSSDKSHLYYNSQGGGFAYHSYGAGDNVTLDNDNYVGIVPSCPISKPTAGTISKCGPETITISKVLSSGSYRFHVMAYDRRGSSHWPTTHLADNGTFVQVFYNNESFNFDVPKRSGNLWTVFDFSVSDNFTQLNIMSNEGDVAKVDDH